MFRKYLILLVASMIILISCKSEFERIRSSSDAQMMHKTADEYYEAGEYSKAILLYEMIIPAYRGKSEAENLAFKFADAHFKNGSYILSAHYFKNYSDTYTSSPKREDALFQSAYSEYRQSPKTKLDQSNSLNAIEAFQKFVNSYPDSEKIAEANTYMDELRIKMEVKAFESGELYYHLKNYSSAIQTLENMLKDYPGSHLTEDAYFLIARASYEWADRSIFLRQQERFNLTINRCDLFIKKHPDSDRIEQIINFKNKCQKALNRFENG